MTAPTLAATAADTRSVRRPLELAEPALLLVTVAAAWSLVRLFDDAGFLPELILVAVLAHTSAALSRRAKLGGFVRLALFLGGGLVLLTALYVPDTALGGVVPTGETFREVDFLLRDSWEDFSAVRAPAPLLPGFLISAGAAVWAAAWMADWIAFRAWAAVEAVIPPAALFIFSALLGTESHRIALSLFFVAAALVFVVLHRAARDGLGSAWVANRGAAGSRALVAWGLPVVVVAILAGAVVGPRLPGADEPAAWAWRDIGRGTSSEQLASPLVDLKPRLVDQSNEELFTVRAERRAYWRLMSLENFNGREWRSSGQFDEIDGDLPHDNRADIPTTANIQSFSIQSPGQVWVPAAFEVVRVEDTSTPLRWDPGAAALIVDTEDGRRNVNGITYTLVSEAPQLSRADVDGAPDDVPDDIADKYLGLPESLDPAVADLAQRVTADATTPAERARALEAYFRSDEFTYSLAPAAGQGSDDLARFLFETKEGYCEQFSAAFAAMARTLGLPSRVAVGYTPGELEPEEGTYSVRGRNAHAWPEVWLAGVGWVPFEPTPGRGLPDAPWSSTQPEDDESSPGGSGPGQSPPPTTTVPGPDQAGTTAPAPTTAPPPGAPTTPPVLTPAPLPDGEVGSEGSQSAWVRVAWGAGAAVATLALWCVGIPLLVRRRTARRRELASGDASARVRLAWTEAAEAVALLGVKPDRAETPLELVARAEAVLASSPSRDGGGAAPRRGRVAGARLGELAELATIARWSAQTLPDPLAAEAEAHRDAVVATVDARLSTPRRVLHRLDPRPLLPDRQPRPATQPAPA